MRKCPIYAILLFAIPVLGQTTTTYTGTVKDLHGTAVTSGRITFRLSAPGGVIPGTGSFAASTVSCLINASGAPVASSDGTSPCIITNNTALTPTGTSYRVCIQPQNASPGSCFVSFATGGTVDLSTIVPTPSTQPSYGVASTQNANTWTQPQTFAGGATGLPTPVNPSDAASKTYVDGKTATVVIAQASETAAQAVARLLTASGGAGGIVIFGPGTWQSGGLSITTPHITLQGSGRAGFNGGYTAMSGGTIIQGTVAASQGADYLTVKDLGIDAGSTWIAAHNGGTPVDGLTIANNGQVVGASQVQGAVIENVSCLGSSTVSATHCMLVENVNAARVQNVVTVMHQHGLVIKGTAVVVDGVYARGHGIDSVIVKSDDYAPASSVQISHVTIAPLLSAGDTKGIYLLGNGAALNYVTLSDIYILSPLAWGIQIQGASSSNVATQIDISNVFVDYAGGSPTSTYCLQATQYVSFVNISNFNCANMWAGIAPYLPLGSFNNFNVVNSNFTNIATNAIETYGRWTVSNSEFVAVTGDAILNDSGATNLGNNIFASVGAMYAGAGSFSYGSPVTEFDNGTCTTAKTIAALNGTQQKVLLTNAQTCALTFTQPTSGTTRISLKVIQSSAGSFNGLISGGKWPGGVAPTITATSAAVDFISCYLDGTNAFCAATQDLR